MRVRIASMLLGAAALGSAGSLASCSTMPSREWPPFDQRTVRATYRADGTPIEVPASSPTLTVLELSIEPPSAAEQWTGGRRRIVPPVGCTHVVVRCVYRAYATNGVLPTPQQVFAAAAKVEEIAP